MATLAILDLIPQVKRLPEIWTRERKLQLENHCGHCSQIHNFTNCTNEHLDPTCANCGNIHQTDSFDCQLYLNQIQKVYKARDIPLPKYVMKALQNKNETKGLHLYN